MTATLPARRPNTNGTKRRPVRIEVDRHALVGSVMDWQALAAAAVDANAAAWQTTLRLPEGVWRDEMQAAHLHAHEALKALLVELRMAAGRLDGITPHAEA